MIPLGEVFLISNTSVAPSSRSDETFMHYSIPSFDKAESPILQKGRDILSNKFVINQPSILISKLNPRILRVWQVEPLSNVQNVCSTEFIVLRPKDPSIVELPFYYHVFNNTGFQEQLVLRQSGTTGSRMRVVPEHVLDIPIPLPPLPVQRRIAEILGSVDAVMDSLRLSLDTLTRLEGQIIEHLLSRGINQSEYGTHPSIGSVPTHWSILPLKSVLLKAQYGLSLPLMASKPANGIPVLRMNNIRHGILDISNVKFLSHIDVTPDYILEDGDVLFNRTNSLDLVGKSACYHANLIFPLTFASYLIRLKPNSNAIIGNFLTLFLNSEKGQQQIRQIITPGVSQANISASNLMEILVPVPPVQEQTKIITFVHAIQKLKASYSAEKDRITSLKTALLSMLLTKHPAVEGVTHV